MVSPEDELTDLLKRLLRLNVRLTSQIENIYHRTFDKQQDPMHRPTQAQRRGRPFHVETKSEADSPASLTSLHVKYDGKGDWASKDPLPVENITWISIPLTTRNFRREICTTCKYKEGLEEVLNILSICGFITKAKEDKVVSPELEKVATPIESTTYRNQQTMNRDISKDVRVTFKKNGSEREFYY